MSHSGSGSDIKLPAFVLSLMLDDHVWLVGSGVPWFRDGCKNEPPKDLDVIIDPRRWSEVVRRVSDDSPHFNKFGGISVVVEGWCVDMWPGYLDDYFRLGGHKVPKYAMSMNPYIILERTND